jgi:hypothetical protein
VRCKFFSFFLWRPYNGEKSSEEKSSSEESSKEENCEKMQQQEEKVSHGKTA